MRIKQQRKQKQLMISFLIASSLSPAKRINSNAFVSTVVTTKRLRLASTLLKVLNDKETVSTASNSNPDPDPDNAQTSTKKSRNKRNTSPCTEPPADPSTFPSWSFEKRDFFRYESIYESKLSQARVGRIHTPHGVIDTPGFVAVATNGALKGLDFRQADEAGQQLVFCNSYHLLLQPGPDVIRDAGGLHTFINRPNRPLITDSGGFQVFSLAYGSVQESLESQGELKRSGSKRKKQNDNAHSHNNSHNNSNNSNNTNNKGSSPPPVKVTEEGVYFRSYRDGTKIFLTPESTVEAQKAYGADIIIPLDQLPPYHIDRELLEESVNRSHRWEARSLKKHLEDVKEQAMYCVVHGGVDVELRSKSVEYLTSLPFDGYAIGGSLGKNSKELLELLQWMMPMFDQGHRKDKPRHLLGIADEASIQGAIQYGIDTFDSCYPTRIARHGTLLTRSGKISIKSSTKHGRAYGIPIDPECSCSTCKHYDRAYLSHLFRAHEPLFIQLAVVHNIQYMNDLMAGYRQDILDGKV